MPAEHLTGWKPSVDSVIQFATQSQLFQLTATHRGPRAFPHRHDCWNSQRQHQSQDGQDN